MKISDEAVEAAEKAYINEWRRRTRTPGVGMREALEAALPYLLAEFVAAVDRIGIGAGSDHFKHGRETMRDDAISAIQDLVHGEQVRS